MQLSTNQSTRVGSKGAGALSEREAFAMLGSREASSIDRGTPTTQAPQPARSEARSSRVKRAKDSEARASRQSRDSIAPGAFWFWELRLQYADSKYSVKSRNPERQFSSVYYQFIRIDYPLFIVRVTRSEPFLPAHERGLYRTLISTNGDKEIHSLGS